MHKEYFMIDEITATNLIKFTKITVNYVVETTTIRVLESTLQNSVAFCRKTNTKVFTRQVISLKPLMH